MKASKYFTRRIIGRVLFVSRILYLLHAAEASCFLRLMSRSVSNFEPRSIVSFHFSSPLWLIENFSVLSVLTSKLEFERSVGTVSSNSLIRSELVDPALQSSAYSWPILKHILFLYLYFVFYCMCDPY